MRYRFEVEFSTDSAMIKLHDLEEAMKYSLLIGPRRSALFFVNLLVDGVENRSDSTASISGTFEKRDLGMAICHVTSSKEYYLIKCDTPATVESRTLEVYPRVLAGWIGETLEKRPNTRVEYEHLT